jgi:hypothetical protein
VPALEKQVSTVRITSSAAAQALRAAFFVFSCQVPINAITYNRPVIVAPQFFFARVSISMVI